MPKPTIQVLGASQLRSQLRRAGTDMGQVRALHQQIGDIIAPAGQRASPRHTGRLAATVRSGATQTSSIVRAGYARVPYAQPIHWGWFRRGIRAQPWLSHTAQNTEPQWFAAYTRGIDQILDHIKGHQ